MLDLWEITVPSIVWSKQGCSRKPEILLPDTAWLSLCAFKTIQKQMIKHRFSGTECNVHLRRKFSYRSETKGCYEGEENRPRHCSRTNRARMKDSGEVYEFIQISKCHVPLLSCFVSIKSTYFTVFSCENDVFHILKVNNPCNYNYPVALP
jgi:hypothetical protein